MNKKELLKIIVEFEKDWLASETPKFEDFIRWIKRSYLEDLE